MLYLGLLIFMNIQERAFTNCLDKFKKFVIFTILHMSVVVHRGKWGLISGNVETINKNRKKGKEEKEERKTEKNIGRKRKIKER